MKRVLLAIILLSGIAIGADIETSKKYLGLSAKMKAGDTINIELSGVEFYVAGSTTPVTNYTIEYTVPQIYDEEGNQKEFIPIHIILYR